MPGMVLQVPNTAEMLQNPPGTRYLNSGVQSIANGGGSVAIQVPRGKLICAVSVIYHEKAPLTPVRVVLSDQRAPTHFQIHLGNGWIWKGPMTKGFEVRPNIRVPMNFGRPQPYLVATIRNYTGSAKDAVVEALISD